MQQFFTNVGQKINNSDKKNHNETIPLKQIRRSARASNKVYSNLNETRMQKP